MKRRICLVMLIIVLMTVLSACGKKYVCSECNRVTKKAYYTYAFDEDELLCEECAREYWMPYNYETFQVGKATVKDIDNGNSAKTLNDIPSPTKSKELQNLKKSKRWNGSATKSRFEQSKNKLK